MSDRVLSSEQAFEKVNNGSLILIDIRRIDEWQTTGVAQGAIALTMDDADFMKTLTTVTHDNKNQPIAVICAAGGRSARVCQALNSQGYNFVFDVSEGMNGGQHGVGWLHKNLPITAYVA